jgi:hypothetical protein
MLLSPPVVYPQGFHITFGVYMARPPGSAKPHVDRDRNEYGDPLAPTNPARERWAREHAAFEPVRLDLEQRRLAEQAITELAGRCGWRIHAVAVQADHAHVVVSAARDPDELREAIKAAASRLLNAKYGARPWWAGGGEAASIYGSVTIFRTR